MFVCSSVPSRLCNETGSIENYLKIVDKYNRLTEKLGLQTPFLT